MCYFNHGVKYQRNIKWLVGQEALLRNTSDGDIEAADK